MIFHNIIINVINSIILILIIPIGKFIANIIKLKINELKHKALKDAAWVLIHASESLITEKNNIKRLDYIITRLKKKFPWASNLKIKEFVNSLLQEIRNNTKK